MVVHPKSPSSKSFFDANAGLSVCTKHPEHISNEQRDFATMSRPKLTSLSRAEMACLHSTAMSSIRWVLRPLQLVLGVVASIRGAAASESRVKDEEPQRLDGRESPSDGSSAAPIRGAGVKEAGRGVSMGPSAIDSTPDLGDVECVRIWYVAISRILGAEPKSR